MGRRRKKDPVDRRKKVTISLVERMHAGAVVTPYRILEELIEAVGDHAHLREAKIAIAWRFGKKADADGRLWLGSAKKGSDLDRAMHGYDFVIILNHEAWNQASFTDAQMTALLDHELAHCQMAYDTNGNVKVDELGRKCYRIRKHDVEEFEGVVKRRGLWKDDVRRLVEAADEQRRRPLLEQAERKARAKPSANGKASSNGKYPGRIQLKRDIMGMNTTEHGLFEGRETEVVGMCNDRVVVRTDSGHRVIIPDEAFDIVRHSKTRPEDLTDLDKHDEEPEPELQKAGEKR